MAAFEFDLSTVVISSRSGRAWAEVDFLPAMFCADDGTSKRVTGGQRRLHLINRSAAPIDVELAGLRLFRPGTRSRHRG